jgi:dolichol-phosphate mannosyltransferase
MVNFGLFISLLSFGVGIYEIYMFLTHQITVLGYTDYRLYLVFIWVIITTIGVTGIYIGKVFDQSRSVRYLLSIK